MQRGGHPSSNNSHLGQKQRKSQLFAIGSEVVAKYDFNAAKTRELCFKKGDILTIVRHANDPEWHHARNSEGEIGIVPTNRLAVRGVQLQAMPWFHGKMDREQAERVLHPREDGLFLVRESNHYPGDYTLCVVFSSGVDHYRVKKDGRGMSVDDETYFSNLIELIEHYTLDKDGLVCELRRPVEKEGQKQFCVDQKAFAESGWVIDQRDIKICEEIGRGEFGVVCKGLYKGSIPVAIKTLKEAKNMDDFLVEASSMTNLHHENLVQLMGIKLSPLPICIVTEYMDKGSLTDYLRSRGRSVVKKIDQYTFSLHVSKAMVYLELKGLVHRDLAAQNVLLNSEGIAKVSDFGLSGKIEHIQAGGKFRVKWSAPEALKDHNNFTHKSDVWSYGILLWEIYSFGRVPYPRIPLNDVTDKVEKGYRMEKPDGCPDHMYSLMLSCWENNPLERPNFEQIRELLEKNKSYAIQ